MKSKIVCTIGMICLIIFIGIASYLWYIYFGEYENKLIAENKGLEFIRGVEFINSGPIDYVNASILDTDEIIPTYHFRVKNNANKDFDYVLSFMETQGTDGCTNDERFSADELEYELKLDNKVIKSGLVSSLENNLLDTNVIKGQSVNDYSLRIWLNKEIVDYENKHFHYIVTMKEK